MTLASTSTRRGLLDGLVVATVGALAGCIDTGETESTNDADATDNESGELDLQEANVVSVEATAQQESYEFTVGLRHDDAGEDGYANWWQVERLDGTRLGRRDLLHSHPNEQPFERSETVDVPSDVDCVVVRGHDQTHGYGGRAVIFTLESGASRAVDQGAEPESFADVDCP